MVPLTEDEAYYRLWARVLQFGYLDHPPMVAWWIRAGTAAVGDTGLGVRLVSGLAAGATSLLIAGLAEDLGADPPLARRAALWWNATLLVAPGGALAIPDAPATLFWVLTLRLAVRAEKTRSTGAWALAGLAAGLACLSKYSALFLGPGLLLWLAASPDGRRRLRTPGPWVALGAAVIAFSPNILWNASHGWMTFAKQFSRVGAGRPTFRFLPELLLGQALLLNPVITGFILAPGGARPAKLAPARRFLRATSLPFLAYLAIHSLHDRVQAHWPAPVYPALATLGAMAAARARAGGIAARFAAAAAPLGLSLGGLVLLHLALPASDIRGLRDPAAMVRGWPGFAHAVDAEAAAAGGAWIGTLSYGVTGQLAAERPARPVVEIIERARYPDAGGADFSRPGVVVDLARRMDLAALRACFRSVQPLAGLVRPTGPGRGEAYAAARVEGPRTDVARLGCEGARPSVAPPRR